MVSKSAPAAAARAMAGKAPTTAHSPGRTAAAAAAAAVPPPASTIEDAVPGSFCAELWRSVAGPTGLFR